MKQNILTTFTTDVTYSQLLVGDRQEPDLPEPPEEDGSERVVFSSTENCTLLFFYTDDFAPIEINILKEKPSVTSMQEINFEIRVTRGQISFSDILDGSGLDYSLENGTYAVCLLAKPWINDMSQSWSFNFILERIDE